MIEMLLCAAAACALVLVLMPRFLPFLRKMKFGQTIYELGPDKHKAKQGTPNMGGVLIGGATVLVALAAMLRQGTFGFSSGMLALLFVALGSMAIGFADDFIKDVKKRHDGLSPIQKIIGQIAVGLLFSWFCAQYAGTEIAVPFTDLSWDLGVFYIPLMTLVVMFMTNSANLQDGVDGLLSSVTVVGMLCFGLLSLFMQKNAGGIAYQSIACAAFALVGACVGFLRFNAHPAKIFMGDTGSMFIGGMTVGIAMLTKTELPMIFIAFTMIMSSVSVIMQRTYFKLTHGKRIFKMSPLHHHFELCGMSENKIVIMYTIVTLALSALAMLSMAQRM